MSSWSSEYGSSRWSSSGYGPAQGSYWSTGSTASTGNSRTHGDRRAEFERRIEFERSEFERRDRPVPDSPPYGDESDSEESDESDEKRPTMRMNGHAQPKPQPKASPILLPPFSGVGVVLGSGAAPTLAPPAPDAVPGSGAASSPGGSVVPGSGATLVLRIRSKSPAKPKRQKGKKGKKNVKCPIARVSAGLK